LHQLVAEVIHHDRCLGRPLPPFRP
jgi:hypothetical protein